MPHGPGKYDDLCTYVREKAGVMNAPNALAGGGCIVIVINGKDGNGFAAQGDPATLGTMPEILDSVARSMREDRRKARDIFAKRTPLMRAREEDDDEERDLDAEA